MKYGLGVISSVSSVMVATEDEEAGEEDRGDGDGIDGERDNETGEPTADCEDWVDDSCSNAASGLGATPVLVPRSITKQVEELTDWT